MMNGKRAVTVIMEGMRPRPHRCRRETEEVMNLKTLVYMGNFSEALLRNTGDVCKESLFSFPGQQTRCFRHPECRELVLAAARDNILCPTI